MNEKDLKKLSRLNLLEILTEQGKEIERLNGLVTELEQKLADRDIKIEKAGSLAEASMALNGVLDAAQAAADQYLENLKNMNENVEVHYNQRMNEAETKSTVMIMAAQERVASMKEDAKSYCDELKVSTEAACKNLKDSTAAECRSMRESTEVACRTLKADTENECLTMQSKASQLLSEAELKSASMIKEAEAKVEQALGSVNQQAAERIKKADDYYNEKMAKVEADVERKWDSLTTRLEAFYQAHAGLRELLAADNMVRRD